MSTTLTTTYPVTCPARVDSVLRLRGIPKSIQDGQLIITPVTVNGNSSFGAEVSGVNWSNPLPDELVKQVRPLSHL